MNFKWFAWFLGALVSYATQGLVKWLGLILPLAIFTMLFGTVGYVVGFAACMAVIIADIHASSGDAFWVETYETALWGYLFGGTVITMMAGSVLSVPIFLAVLAACYGLTWGSFRLAELCERKANVYTQRSDSAIQAGV